MFEVVGYHCDFCGESSLNRAEIQQHENQCSFNPINRTCDSCKYFVPNIPYLYGDRACMKLDKNLGNNLRFHCNYWELLDE